MNLSQPARRLPRESQRFVIMAAVEPGEDHAIVSDLRGPQECGSIRRLRDEYGMDKSLRYLQGLFGLIHLAQIWRDRYALHSRHTHVGIAHLQGKVRIPLNIRSEAAQILERSVHDQLPGLSAAR